MIRTVGLYLLDFFETNDGKTKHGQKSRERKKPNVGPAF
jgi:hypothetical protein